MCVAGAGKGGQGSRRISTQSLEQGFPRSCYLLPTYPRAKFELKRKESSKTRVSGTTLLELRRGESHRKRYSGTVRLKGGDNTTTKEINYKDTFTACFHLGFSGVYCASDEVNVINTSVPPLLSDSRSSRPRAAPPLAPARRPGGPRLRPPPRPSGRRRGAEARRSCYPRGLRAGASATGRAGLSAPRLAGLARGRGRRGRRGATSSTGIGRRRLSCAQRAAGTRDPSRG